MSAPFPVTRIVTHQTTFAKDALRAVSQHRAAKKRGDLESADLYLVMLQVSLDANLAAKKRLP